MERFRMFIIRILGGRGKESSSVRERRKEGREF